MASPLTQINLPHPIDSSSNRTSLLGPLTQAGAAIAGGFIGRSNIISGGQFSAGQVRQAGNAAMLAANYNAQLQQLDLSRQLDTMSRQIGRISSEQRLAAVNTSGRISKSALSVINDSLSTFERQVVQTRETSKLKQEQILFEGRLRQVQQENQARAIEFQSQQQAFSSLGSTFQAIPTLLGGLF